MLEKMKTIPPQTNIYPKSGCIKLSVLHENTPVDNVGRYTNTMLYVK